MASMSCGFPEILSTGMQKVAWHTEGVASYYRCAPGNQGGQHTQNNRLGRMVKAMKKRQATNHRTTGEGKVGEVASNGLPQDRNGMVDLRIFKRHPLNPNSYIAPESKNEIPNGEKWTNLMFDVRAAKGPCTKVETWKRPDNTWEVLSGWHNLKACIQVGIKKLPAESIKVHQITTQWQADYILLSRNRTGDRDKTMTRILIGRIHAQAGSSLLATGRRLGLPKATIQVCVDTYTLHRLVESDHQHLLERVVDQAILAIVRRTRKSKSKLQATTLTQAFATPTVFVKGCSSLSEKQKKAVKTFWGSRPCSAVQAMAVMDGLPAAGTIRKAFVAKLLVDVAPKRSVDCATQDDTNNEGSGRTAPSLLANIIDVLRGIEGQIRELKDEAEIKKSRETLEQVARLVDTCRSALPSVPKQRDTADDPKGKRTEDQQTDDAGDVPANDTCAIGLPSVQKQMTKEEMMDFFSEYLSN